MRSPSEASLSEENSNTLNPARELTGKQRRHLRALAHHLDPVVLVGSAGTSEAVAEKLRFELEHHELVKVRFPESEVKENAPALAASVGAHLVQTIGRIAVLYRRRDKKPTIQLPQAT